MIGNLPAKNFNKGTDDRITGHLPSFSIIQSIKKNILPHIFEIMDAPLLYSSLMHRSVNSTSIVAIPLIGKVHTVLKF